MAARPVVCVQGILRHPDGQRILVSETPGAGFQRLFGGRVEHWELSHEALGREVLEELGLLVEVGELRGVLQNRFEHLGERGHEVVFVHTMRFLDDSLHDRDRFVRVDGVDDVGLWRSLADPPDVPLYVEGWETLL